MRHTMLVPLRLLVRDQPPPDPVMGDMYFNSVQKTVLVYDGEGWNGLQGGGVGDDTTWTLIGPNDPGDPTDLNNPNPGASTPIWIDTDEGSSGGGGSNLFSGLGVVYATPSEFPGIDPTGVNSSTAGFTDFIAAIPDGGVGVIPAGTYRLTAKMRFENKSVTVQAHGAHFVGEATNGMVELIGGYEAIQTVSSVTERLTTAGEYGHAGENMWVTDITLAGPAPAWKTGDLIKIVSDDVPVDPDIATLRTGQTVTVVEVVGAKVVVAGTLRDEYATNVRCAKYLTHQMKWEGGVFRHHDSLLVGAVGVNMFYVNALINPIIENVKIEAAVSQTFAIRRCYGARVVNCVVDYAQDTGSKYGYAVNDSSEYTRVDGLSARRVRHAYTTGAGGATAGSTDLSNYGKTFGAVITNGYCQGATQTAWDTHGDGDNISFLNCMAVDCYGGFQLRGTNHRIVGGMVLNAKESGVSVSTASSAKYSYGSTIGGGLVLDRCNSTAIAVTSTKGFQARATTIDGVHVRNRNTKKAVLHVDAATVWLGSVSVEDGGVRVTTANSGVVTAMPLLTDTPTEPVPVVLTNTAEGQAGGVVATIDNTGGGSGDPFNVIVGGPTFTAAQMFSGARSYRCDAIDGASSYLSWTDLLCDTASMTFYFRVDALPTVNDVIVGQFRNSTKSCGDVRVNRDGKVSILSSYSTILQTSSTLITAGTWYRVVMTITPGPNTTDGTFNVSIYVGANGTAAYQYTGTNVDVGNQPVTEIRLGKTHSTGTATVYIDGVTANVAALGG